MPDTSDKKRQYSAPALSKGLDILELLANEAEGLSLSEISEKLGRSTSEIFRMLHVLEDRKYISTLPASDRYSLTLKMFELSFRQPRLKRLTGAAVPAMQELTSEILQACHLVVYYAGRGIVIAQQESPAVSGFSVRLGSEVPLVNTCSGNLLLSHATNEKRAEMLSHQPREFKRSATKKELNDVRERVLAQGFEHVASSLTRGVEDIGFPIFDYTGAMVAALVVPFLAHLDTPDELTPETAVPYLRKAAQRISRALGSEYPAGQD